jgi:tRNA(adenine34) deaminase
MSENLGMEGSDATRAAPLSDLDAMGQALALAQRAADLGEVPVGAVVVHDGRVIAEGWNHPIGSNDPTAHAEIIALRAAAECLGNYRLLGATLYVTLEPCAMCAGALVLARIARLVFGAWDPRAGAVRSVFEVVDHPRLNHRMDWEGGVREAEAAALLRGFFSARRGGT